MPPPSHTVGGVEVTALHDATGPMGPPIGRPLGELFGGPQHPVWSHASAPDPATDPWILHFHCFLLRPPTGPTILVDTGIGTTNSPAASWAPVPGRLAAQLAATGTSPEDIDIVVLTHLHSDHVSGSLAPDGTTPAFPNARYLVQRAEAAWLAAQPADPVTTAIIEPLRRAGSLQLIEAEMPLGPAITILPTPGHTPGHQCVVVGDHELLIAGDLLHHAVQLLDPSAAYYYDHDPAAASAIRTQLLDSLRSRHGILAAAHLDAPFTRL